MIKKLFLFFLLCLPCCLCSKAIVFTTGFNRPDFIELQHRLFKKFLKDDYEFWVISDANTPEMQRKIMATCRKLGIHCVNVPQKIHNRPYLPRKPGDNFNNPNVRHCNASQWAWDHFFSKHNGSVMLIDSDMFLIRPFSIENTLAGKHLAGIMWGTVDPITDKPYDYLWLALILFNNSILPHKEKICFNCGMLPNTQAVCDSGGWTHLYLNEFRDSLKLHDFSFLPGNQFHCPYRYGVPGPDLSDEQITQDLKRRGFTENEIKLALQKPYTIELIGNNQFLHYRAGSNYEKYSDNFLSEKDRILLEFFETILAE